MYNDDNKKKIELLKEIFDNVLFNAFNFSGYFRLSFERIGYIQDVKYPIPNNFDLVLWLTGDLEVRVNGNP